MGPKQLTSDEVPGKFVEWLLSMGCPAEKVPTLEAISEMCKGQYYMVWRSLMERVQSKHIIREKKLQVFCDDIRLCKQRSPFSEKNSAVIEPLQLTVWNQQTELKKNVANAEKRLNEAHKDLNVLIDKVSVRLAQKNMFSQRIQDLKRRVWVLRHLKLEIKIKKAHVDEAKDVANKLTESYHADDVQSKIDKCVALMSKTQPIYIDGKTSPVFDMQPEAVNALSDLVKCHGYLVWPKLMEMRSKLVASMAATNSAFRPRPIRRPYKAIVTDTAALHSNLALEIVKDRTHIKQTRKKIQAAIRSHNASLSGEACELFVLQCERARAEAKVRTLRSLLEELRAATGPFQCNGEESPASNAHMLMRVSSADREIACLKDDVENTVKSLAQIECNLYNMKDCLELAFKGSPHDDVISIGRYKDVPVNVIRSIISSHRKFYADGARNKNSISLELNTSDELLRSENAIRLTDELKFYLKNFSIEKNRKILFGRGKKIWIYENVSALERRLQERWMESKVTPMLCPSRTLGHNLKEIMHCFSEKQRLTELGEAITWDTKKININLQKKIETQDRNEDLIKKAVANNMAILEDTKQNIAVCEEHIKFWSDNEIRKYVPSNRIVGGLTFCMYEDFCQTLK
ncbi:unnamed protein product [Leptidea sinapis]|uniref:Uncharacterized protein n=1 Tax=Leptidea sinapis TaxID=189913 RepID=A0A5E4Q798_9NEOP|nr:unnamed protein product [Leptidea sinapis]